MKRDDAYWVKFSAAVEAHDYTIVGPVELGPAATPELREQVDGRAATFADVDDMAFGGPTDE